jgi:hypothetical protein
MHDGPLDCFLVRLVWQSLGLRPTPGNESTGNTYVLYHEIKQQQGARMNWDAVNEALASD